MTPSPPTGTPSTRDRIVEAAMRLLAEGGRDAVSTRAVCDAADVQPPTIYRLFGSKDGLLDEVAREGFLLHRARHRGLDTDDPVEDLRSGWDQHVAFGLENPYLYSVMYGRGDPDTQSLAAVAANDGLRYAINRIAQAGMLRVDERFAAAMITAAGVGVTFMLLSVPAPDRSMEDSVRMRELILGSIIADRPAGSADGIVGAAITLSALLDASSALHPSERALMQHWLDRLAGTGTQ